MTNRNIDPVNASYPALSFQSMRGLSLIELLIALALSLTLIIGVLTIYMDSNDASRTSTALARVQEGARIGLEMLSREVRMSGFQGCPEPYTTPLNVIAANPPPSLAPAAGSTNSYLLNTSIQGWEVTPANRSNWANGADFDGVAGITSGTSQAIADSDVLMVQRFRLLDAQISADMASEVADIVITDPAGVFGSGRPFAAGSMLMIGNCEALDLFRLSADPAGAPLRLRHQTPINTTANLSRAYLSGEDAQLYALQSSVYFVGDTGRDDDRGDPIFALYRATNDFPNAANPSFTVEELVEGVESLQIQYGIRRDAPSNQVEFVTADALTPLEWREVVSVRVGVLVSGVESILIEDDDNTYDLPGARFTDVGANTDFAHAADRRLRKAFTSSLDIRNRQCGSFKQLPGTALWEWDNADNTNADGDPCS
ncbi:MAG: PilW family protein [Pseudomonadales bacterium]|nr:PilW family protein [Pseudomonadales bacterium]